MAAGSTSIRVNLAPDPSSWAGVVQAAAPVSARAHTFRKELGLPTDRPIVMSGHQADLWHPGILAKYFALQSIAARTGAHAVWLVVDQDTHVPELTAPVRLADGRLVRRQGVTNLPSSNVPSVVPTARRSPARDVVIAPLSRGERYASDETAESLSRAVAALNARADQPSLARQFAHAALDLLKDLGPAPQLLFATDLARTALMRDLITDMRTSAQAMSTSYNAAVERHPDGHVAPLDVADPVAPEVPVWRVDPAMNSARARISTVELGETDPARIVPRALLMTGMLRWLGCELFIHGTGGAGATGESGYDAITRDWLSAWLGATLAPSALATATMYLDIPTPGGLITPEEIARLRWKLHAANHRPAMLNDDAGETARERAVATLIELRRKRDARSREIKQQTYRQLHQTLELVRDRHASELHALQLAADAAASRKAEAEIVGDRTWSFALHSPERLRDLQSEIQRQIG